MDVFRNHKLTFFNQIMLMQGITLHRQDNVIFINISKAQDFLSNSFRVDGYILIINDILFGNTDIDNKFPKIGEIWTRYGIDANNVEFITNNGKMMYFADECSMNLVFELSNDYVERIIHEIKDIN